MAASNRDVSFNAFEIAPDCWSELRALAAVGRSGSYLGAARMLHVSVPTVTRACERLRDIVGEDILVATPRGVQLTAAGESLFKAALAINHEVKSALKHLGQDKSDVAGEVTISVLEGIAAVFVTPNIGWLTASFPNLSVEVLNPTSAATSKIPHIVLTISNIEDAYDYVECGRLFLTTIATRSYVDQNCGAPPLDPAALDFVQCSYYVNPTFAAWNRVRVLGRTRFTCESSLSYVASVMADHGVGLLANYTLSDHRLAVVPLGVEISLPLYVGRLKAKKRQPAVRVVHDWLLELLGKRTPWFRERAQSLEEVKYLDLASSPALF